MSEGEAKECSRMHVSITLGYRVLVHGQGASGWCFLPELEQQEDSVFCGRLCCDPVQGRLSRSRFNSSWLGCPLLCKFHGQEHLPFFLAVHLEHQNNCLVLGMINKPMGCSGS